MGTFRDVNAPAHESNARPEGVPAKARTLDCFRRCGIDRVLGREGSP